MENKLNFHETDRTEYLEWLEEKAIERRNRKLESVELELGHYDEIEEKLRNKYPHCPEFYLNDCLKALETAYANCDFHQSEIILGMMPETFKENKKYTHLLDTFLTPLYRQKKLHQEWQPCKAAVVEQMCCHHKDKEIRLTGLEILVACDIGSGVGNNDLGYELCKMTECEWVWTSYLNAQDAEGYRVPDKYCPVHGDQFYTPKMREELLMRWDNLIRKNQ